MARTIPPAAAATGAATEAPRLRHGAYDQFSAYEARLARWRDVDPGADEEEWQIVKRRLQQTRRELGQRPLFPE